MAKIFFFSLNYKSFPIQTRFEQLSSPIRWRVIAISKRDVFQPRLGFVGVEIFTNFWCFVHTFGHRYARKSFKGSKDVDFGLVSEKILSHNNGPIGWVQVNITKNTPTCGVPPRKPPPKTKKFFFDFNYKTCWIHREFEQLSSSIAWQVLGLQSSAWNVVFVGLKGLNIKQICSVSVKAHSTSDVCFVDFVLFESLKAKYKICHVSYKFWRW